MEARIAKLEELVADTRERLVRIETRLEQTATKADVAETKSDIAELRADMQKGFADMAKWVVGTAVGMGAAGIVVMTFVLNNAVPKPVPPVQVPVATAAPASIVIYATPLGIDADATAPAGKP